MFIEYFVSAVVGKIKYKENRCEKMLSSYATTSDEALLILIYENNIETWKDMAMKDITKNSDVSRKYTNGGSSKGEIASSRRYEGWSAAGYKRFNEIFDVVKQDRASQHAKAFEETFREYCFEGGMIGKKKKVAQPMYEAIEVRHDLWSEEANDDIDNLDDNAGKEDSEDAGDDDDDQEEVGETMAL